MRTAQTQYQLRSLPGVRYTYCCAHDIAEQWSNSMLPDGAGTVPQLDDAGWRRTQVCRPIGCYINTASYTVVSIAPRCTSACSAVQEPMLCAGTPPTGSRVYAI